MKKLLFLLPVLFLATSCDKDDDDDTTGGNTKADVIAKAAWKFETVGRDTDKDGDIDEDATAFIEPCVKDNTFKLETNGTGVASEGATKCATTAPDTTPFTWAFTDNETALNITGNAVLGFGGKYKIITLSDTRLTLSKDTTLPFYGASTLVANFNH